MILPHQKEILTVTLCNQRRLDQIGFLFLAHKIVSIDIGVTFEGATRLVVGDTLIAYTEEERKRTL